MNDLMRALKQAAESGGTGAASSCNRVVVVEGGPHEMICGQETQLVAEAVETSETQRLAFRRHSRPGIYRCSLHLIETSGGTEQHVARVPKQLAMAGIVQLLAFEVARQRPFR